MGLTKTSNLIYSDDHDSFIILLKEDSTYEVYKNSQFMDPLEIEDAPEEIQEMECGENFRTRSSKFTV